MRVLPGMTVIVPADAEETRQVIRWAAQHDDGPVYVRLTREKFPTIFDSNYKFEVGKAHVVRPGDDVTIMACGLMTANSLAAVTTPMPTIAVSSCRFVRNSVCAATCCLIFRSTASSCLAIVSSTAWRLSRTSVSVVSRSRFCCCSCVWSRSSRWRTRERRRLCASESGCQAVGWWVLQNQAMK